MDQLTFDDTAPPEVTEEWRPVVGWPDFMVSNLGRVYSVPRPMAAGGIMKLNATASGYLSVTLDGNPGRQVQRRVHVLVARAFIGACPKGQEVCHNDGVRWHNARSNLRYDTRSGNQRDRRKHGTDHNVNKTHCPSDHEYTPENTDIRQAVDGTVSRFCLTCRPIKARERYERCKAEGTVPAWKPSAELAPDQLARRREKAAARMRRRRQRQDESGLKCATDGCDKPVRSGELCSTCYGRQRDARTKAERAEST